MVLPTFASILGTFLLPAILAQNFGNLEISQRPSSQAQGTQLAVVQTGYSSGISIRRGPKRYPGRSKCGPVPPDNINVTLNVPLPLRTITVSQSMIFINDVCNYEVDMDLTTPQMILRRGYPAEIHKVLTKDGYILEMHRIPNYGKPPVLLQHGLLSSSASWVLTGPEKGLAYILWREGFDVWMGNFRDTEYSRLNRNISPYNFKFWDFSHHEFGLYDVSAQIDHVLKYTMRDKIDYIGHSLGTVAFFVLTSMRPEYNQKIRQMHALSPVVFLSGVRSPVLRIAGVLVANYNETAVVPDINIFHQLGQDYCIRDGPYPRVICATLLFLLGGFNPGGLDLSLLPVILSHFQPLLAVKTFQHFSQQFTGKFRQFDYGWKENLERYNSLVPPNYNLKAVTAPVYVYYSVNDWILSANDARKVEIVLPNAKSYCVPDKKFTHTDFLWANDVEKVLYNKLLANLQDEDN